MRLYLLPISTRRTLLYCQKLDANSSESKTLVDKATARAAKLWAGWEKKEKGWQKTIVNYGNYAFRRMPYEEWGLKSVPPLSKKRQQEDVQGKEKIQVVYPEAAIPTKKALGVLQTLGTERQALHKTRLTWCFVGMPLTAPFALVPVIPNIPFFFLVYRAWSHWRALAGGKHIQFLSSNDLLTPVPSPILDSVYRSRILSSVGATTTSASISERPAPSDAQAPEEEKMLLSQEDVLELATALDIPELEVEIERAVWQVQTALEKEREKQRETETGQGKEQEKNLNASSQPASPHPKAETEKHER